jgi:ubiquinone biosynthesis protein
MLQEVLRMVRQHGLQVPPDFLLLLRALSTAESIGRELDPEFNIMQHLQPFAEQLVLERYDPRYLLRKLGHSTQDIEELLVLLPAALSQIMQKLRRGEFHLGLEVQQLDRLIREFDTASNRLTLAIILAASSIGSALIMQTTCRPCSWISAVRHARLCALGCPRLWVSHCPAASWWVLRRRRLQ